MAAVYVSPSRFYNQQFSQSMMSLLGANVDTTVNIPVTIITITITTATTTINNTANSDFISACFNRIAPLTIGCL
jgi:hypothetical protein